MVVVQEIVVFLYDYHPRDHSVTRSYNVARVPQLKTKCTPNEDN